uniref:P2X purinoreceptor 7 intracellular domain-containing protein n=1 Tax=Biomphalaria glabrata TaxID=6526 RepID=A0A2C9KIH9_BIOGL
MAGVSNAEPYMFEPQKSQSLQSKVSQSPVLDRMNSSRLSDTTTFWCKCGCCKHMDTENENICCTEIHNVSLKMSSNNLPCISNHPGFRPVCLDKDSLQTAHHNYRELFGDHFNDKHEQYRYTAYRQFVRWCWGCLGRSIRVPLPSCVVNKISCNPSRS